MPLRSEINSAFLRRVAAITFLIVGFLTAVPSASAAHRDMTVDFEQLDVRARKGALAVTYEIERADWRRLHRAGVVPRLYVYQPRHRGGDRYLTWVELDERAGYLGLPRHAVRPDLRRLRFRLVGHSRRLRIDQMRLASSCGEKVTVAVQRRHHKRRKPRRNHGQPWRAQLVKACSDHLYTSDDIAACIQRGNRSRAASVQVVEACADATYTSRNLLSCMDKAATVRRNPVGVVKACSKNTYHSGAFTQCVSDVARYRSNPVPVIGACADATYHPGAFRGCLKAADGAGRNAAAVIRACDDGTYWHGAFEQCVEAATHRRRG